MNTRKGGSFFECFLSRFYSLILIQKKMKKIPKEEIYKHGNFTVSEYDFEIPSGEKS